MIHLYTQDAETIVMYERRAVDSLKSSNLLTDKDVSGPINKSRKYMLVQQMANDIYVSSGMLRYSDTVVEQVAL